MPTQSTPPVGTVAPSLSALDCKDRATSRPSGRRLVVTWLWLVLWLGADRRGEGVGGIGGGPGNGLDKEGHKGVPDRAHTLVIAQEVAARVRRGQLVERAGDVRLAPGGATVVRVHEPVVRIEGV